MDNVFWVISKIFWYLASPNTSIFLILLAGVGLLFLGREKLGKKLIVASTALIFLISFLPVYETLLLPLENRFPIPEPLPEKVHGVIVLGGAEIPKLTQLRGQVSLTESVDRLTTFVTLLIMSLKGLMLIILIYFSKLNSLCKANIALFKFFLFTKTDILISDVEITIIFIFFFANALNIL